MQTGLTRYCRSFMGITSVTWKAFFSILYQYIASVWKQLADRSGKLINHLNHHMHGWFSCRMPLPLHEKHVARCYVDSMQNTFKGNRWMQYSDAKLLLCFKLIPFLDCSGRFLILLIVRIVSFRSKLILLFSAWYNHFSNKQFHRDKLLKTKTHHKNIYIKCK